ncbi:hypothetical protein CMV_023771 [Castanea mollissima]|uniref:Uncharacterized protein n=1 Tax=Castanea mollissima TaxID=60419 RepID=A0A8J4QNX6_9ROSI|nr:hypothetical protein CMV_023771 [Castanea mollissima]KAF3950484.1 hypothetical protein CMV_023771 [Castanea mollissima]
MGKAQVALLLARSNLLITRDIEWANLMLGFEQILYFQFYLVELLENRYAIGWSYRWQMREMVEYSWQVMIVLEYNLDIRNDTCSESHGISIWQS